MLIDKVEVVFKGGAGGHGKMSFRANRKGPDGGNGGKGGDLYVTVSSDLTLLNQFSDQKEFSAENGFAGSKNTKTGKGGSDFTIILPVGTSIIEKKSGKIICELDKIGQTILLCRGGEGGFGNREFRSSVMTSPKYAQKGQKGQRIEAILSLKLIADFGLIGLPNSGKSSLLNELTGAHAKTADYAFTTLSPNLGVFEGKIIADIPGLIEGASGGKGLGTGFLKHIEKVRVLIHCISSTSLNIKNDYLVVRNELKKFNPELAGRKEIILLTKSDLAAGNLTFKDAIKVSIYDLDSINNLKSKLKSL